ncbi:MAG: AAA family ATPase [Bacillales bacterium]|jgi:hypothetical protein|nr:AAA family ATPase [Bacillales bacterium]
MNNVGKEIFKALHTGKWLSIEYKNNNQAKTHYWISIIDIIYLKKILLVDGLHVNNMKLTQLTINYDNILSATIVEETYYEPSQKLIEDIALFPLRYAFMFSSVPKLKVLDYYELCHKLDTTPYKSDYALINLIDEKVLMQSNEYILNDEQFKEIVKKFHNKKNKDVLSLKQLAINMLSINTNKGLYVLAYRKVYLNVKRKALTTGEIVINSEFSLEGYTMSAKYFLAEEDFYLLDNFLENITLIKDCITSDNIYPRVDDLPHFITIAYDIHLDLASEYKAITTMTENQTETEPIKAFFGEIKDKPRRNKNYPLIILNKKIDIDQMLAIHNIMKYPITYIQGPPGTGKTNTIINTIITAFFNHKTVLACSYNNHPIDSIFKALSSLKFNEKTIPFPVIRLGNEDNMKEALLYLINIVDTVEKITVYEDYLIKTQKGQEDKLKELSNLLKNYEDRLELLERKETMEKVKDSNKSNISLSVTLPMQLENLENKLKEKQEINTEDALKLLDIDIDKINKFLYYYSARTIKHIFEPKHKNLLDILYLQNKEDQFDAFKKYFTNDENMQKFLNIFPVVITTNISAHKLGEPKPYFDIVIMDEASQCNTAVSLIPIIRGNNLVLVGDPQQLKPVIVLDKKINSTLMSKYEITSNYNYIENSIYDTYLKNDTIGEEILLSHHYRCNKKIIQFNNQKYYNNKLKIKTINNEQKPLLFIDVPSSNGDFRNTSSLETDEIIKYIKENENEKIAVVTPFVNQKRVIQNRIDKENLENIIVGTVHTFQGDEKDTILFSLGIGKSTLAKTYDWLKNNSELINVATSRPKNKLVIFGDYEIIDKLHNSEDDDLYELIKYVKTNGETQVSKKTLWSRALGFKPYSSEIEDVFLETLNHALNITSSFRNLSIKKEVNLSTAFMKKLNMNELFYTGKIDFVIYEKRGKVEYPILAFELNGTEHEENETVKKRDAMKKEICNKEGLELIIIPNSYARRYNHIKDILINSLGE